MAAGDAQRQKKKTGQNLILMIRTGFLLTPVEAKKEWLLGARAATNMLGSMKMPFGSGQLRAITLIAGKKFRCDDSRIVVRGMQPGLRIYIVTVTIYLPNIPTSSNIYPCEIFFISPQVQFLLILFIVCFTF